MRTEEHYARLSDSNLQTRLEARILEKCRETAIHRRAEISGISGQIQEAFDKLVTWTTRVPSTLQE